MEVQTPRRRIDYVGRSIGAAALMVGAAEGGIAAGGYMAQRPLIATLLVGLSATTLGMGNYFWRHSAAEPSREPEEDPPPPLEYTWAEGIGRVPLEPYDPKGPSIVR